MKKQITASSENITLFSRKPFIKWGCIVVLMIIFYAFAVNQTNASIVRVFSSLPVLITMIVQDFFPPDFSYFPVAWNRLIETGNIALISTTLAAIVSFPFIFLTSHLIDHHSLFYKIFKFVLSILRSIPTLILAVLMVALVGLGATSGMLALTVYSFAVIIKLSSESMEAIDNRPLDAMRAIGGNKLQLIRYGIVPQIMPLYFSHILYVFELNLKSSVVLGFVGAGGIGQLIRRQMSLFRYDRLGMIIILLFVTISLIDYASQSIRSHLL